MPGPGQIKQIAESFNQAPPSFGQDDTRYTLTKVNGDTSRLISKRLVKTKLVDTQTGGDIFVILRRSFQAREFTTTKHRFFFATTEGFVLPPQLR